MNNVYAVIMAGGSGERFWPMSRKYLPKQFLPIVSKKTMLEETLERLKGIIPEKRIYVVTNKMQEHLVKGCKNIIVEFIPRNTAPCIAISAGLIKEKDATAVMVVLPADHKIKDVSKFQNRILDAVRIAEKDNVLVTLGIKPNSPHTGYGYIKKGERLDNGVYKVLRFTEKPDLDTAKRYLAGGRYFWNSGMFIWKVSAILEEIEKYLPNIYRNKQKISIDYGVMEKTDRAVVLEADFNWDDVGNWASLDKHKEKDKYGNIIEGRVLVQDVNNSTIITDSPLVAAIGISDVIVVVQKDAVLICPKNKAEEVKNIIEIMKKDKIYKKYL